MSKREIEWTLVSTETRAKHTNSKTTLVLPCLVHIPTMTTPSSVTVDKAQTVFDNTGPPSALSTTTPAPAPNSEPEDIKYIQYSPDLELQYLTPIRALISQDLSEPYSIYVYRYFLYQWGDLCFMVSLPLSPQSLSRKSTGVLRPRPRLYDYIARAKSQN